MKKFKNRLTELKKQNLFSQRVIRTSKTGRYVSIQGEELLNFGCNDYLGLSSHPAVLLAASKAAQMFGYGATGSPMSSGYTSIHQELEYAIAEFMGYEKALLFSSEYLANFGVAQGLLSKNDVIIQDERNHPSLLDAAKISEAKLKTYSGGNHKKIRKLLQDNAENHPLLCSNGLFGVDGKKADLASLSSLAEKHTALLWVNDSHGVAVHGERGKGIIEEQQLGAEKVPILTASFGKAFGTVGGFVVSSNTIIENIIQLVRSYQFSTALPVADVAATLHALQIVKTEPWRREKIFDLAEHYRKQIKKYKLETFSQARDSAIQTYQLKTELKALELQKYLSERGIYVVLMRPPAVEKNTCYLRFSLTCMHEKEDIDLLIQCLIGNY
ncbi:MAG: 8-amino-7-oxononanoate synthase [Proteobacteria bacterium]|nr:8-amino-7-oxononanoate synthase [Pseudomonadota bacterium]